MIIVYRHWNSEENGINMQLLLCLFHLNSVASLRLVLRIGGKRPDCKFDFSQFHSTSYDDTIVIVQSLAFCAFCEWNVYLLLRKLHFSLWLLEFYFIFSYWIKQVSIIGTEPSEQLCPPGNIDNTVLLQNSSIGIHIVDVLIDLPICEKVRDEIGVIDWYKRCKFSFSISFSINIKQFFSEQMLQEFL